MQRLYSAVPTNAAPGGWKPRATGDADRLRGLDEPAKVGFVATEPGTSVPRLHDPDGIALSWWTEVDMGNPLMRRGTISTRRDGGLVTSSYKVPSPAG